MKNSDGTIDWDATKKNQDAYISKLSDRAKGDAPSDKELFQGFLDYSEAQRSPQEQRLDAFNKSREAAGYYEPKAKAAELDKIHPNLDVESWYLGAVGKGKEGATAPALQTTSAVDQALKIVHDEDLKNRPVKLAGFQRPVNATPQAEQAWKDFEETYGKYQKAIDANLEGFRQYYAADNPNYAKPLDQLDSQARGTLEGQVKGKLREGNPALDAWLAWWGTGSDKATLQTQAAATEFQKLRAKYGNEPAKEGYKVVLSQNAR